MIKQKVSLTSSMVYKAFKVFVVRGLGALAMFLMSLAVTNSTSTHQAGLVLYAIGLVMLLGPFMSLGSPIFCLKVVAANHTKNTDLVNRVMSSSISVTLLCSFTLALFIYVFGDSLFLLLGVEELGDLKGFIILGVLSFSLVEVLYNAFLGEEKSALASFLQNVMAMLLFVLVIGTCILLGYTLDEVELIVMYSITVMLTAVLSLALWYLHPRYSFNFSLALTNNQKESMRALFIVLIMTQSTQWAGQIATGMYLDPEKIAFFSTAQRTAMLASFVLLAVNLVVAPKFASAFDRGASSEVNKLSLISSRLMLIFSIPVLTIMLVFPDRLMMLFGEEYIIAADLLRIMAVGQFINVVTGSVGYLLNMTGHEKDFRNVVIISGPVAIILAFILTREFGVMGAAYATAISVATQNLLAVAMVKRRLGFNTLNIFRAIN